MVPLMLSMLVHCKRRLNVPNRQSKTKCPIKSISKSIENIKNDTMYSLYIPYQEILRDMRTVIMLESQENLLYIC